MTIRRNRAGTRGEEAERGHRSRGRGSSSASLTSKEESMMRLGPTIAAISTLLIALTAMVLLLTLLLTRRRSAVR